MEHNAGLNEGGVLSSARRKDRMEVLNADEDVSLPLVFPPPRERFLSHVRRFIS